MLGKNLDFKDGELSSFFGSCWAASTYKLYFLDSDRKTRPRVWRGSIAYLQKGRRTSIFHVMIQFSFLAIIINITVLYTPNLKLLRSEPYVIHSGGMIYGGQNYAGTLIWGFRWSYFCFPSLLFTILSWRYRHYCYTKIDKVQLRALLYHMILGFVSRVWLVIVIYHALEYMVGLGGA